MEFEFNISYETTMSAIKNDLPKIVRDIKRKDRVEKALFIIGLSSSISAIILAISIL